MTNQVGLFLARPSKVVQNPYALTRNSRQNYVQGLPYHIERARKGMVQQAYLEHNLHLQRVEWTLRYTLYWRVET